MKTGRHCFYRSNHIHHMMHLPLLQLLLLPSVILVIGIMASAAVVVVVDSQSADVDAKLLPANSSSSNESSNNVDGDEASGNGLVASPLKADAASRSLLIKEGSDAVSSKAGGHSFSRDNIITAAVLLSGDQMMTQHVHDSLSAASLVCVIQLCAIKPFIIYIF